MEKHSLASPQGRVLTETQMALNMLKEYPLIYGLLYDACLVHSTSDYTLKNKVTY